MKKNLFFILLLFLLSCNGGKQQATTEKCPRVLFSKEHTTYITSDESPLTIENISYRAKLNNYSFNKKCFLSNNVLTSQISILFVVEPDQNTQADVLLPFYVATLNAEDEVLDMQYYSAKGKIKKDPETFNYIETELIKTLVINIPNKDKSINQKTSLIIGFMLDQEKNKLLN